MKCVRCGKRHGAKIDICDECGFDIKTYRAYQKVVKEGPKPEDINDNIHDLIDRPIMAFIFGILGLLFPFFVFSILAIKISPRPARSNLAPVRKLGIIMGYIGLVLSSVTFIVLGNKFIFKFI